jgi:hypothetical protein
MEEDLKGDGEEPGRILIASAPRFSLSAVGHCHGGSCQPEWRPSFRVPQVHGNFTASGRPDQVQGELEGPAAPKLSDLETRISCQVATVVTSTSSSERGPLPQPV